MEIQDTSKKFFLFCFYTKRDVDGVLKTSPWSFDDRNILASKHITRAEQSSKIVATTKLVKEFGRKEGET